VIAYDIRGWGRSTNNSRDFQVHIDDAAAVVSSRGAAPAIMVGWSLGASIALGLALRQPDLVRSLVVVEPGWHWNSPPRPAILKVAVKAQWQVLRGRGWEAASEVFARWVMSRQSGGTGWDDAPQWFRDMWLANVEGWKFQSWGLRGMDLLADYSTEDLGACAVPVTYLLGADSNPIFHRDHETLASALPRVRTVTVPGACHLLPVERPEAVVDAVRSAAT
jgi:pimeloyl-ACP methyl ester carboxylesterase